MDKKNIKFYIMMVCSIVMYCLSIVGDQALCGVAIILLIITISKSTNLLLNYIGRNFYGSGS